MCNSAAHNSRPQRESLSKRLGKVARAIKARDGRRCVYCGGTEASTGAHLHLDHLTPRAAGGQDVATNLVVCCIRCNSARKDMPLAKWARVSAEKFSLSFAPAAIRAQARRVLPEVL
jgi:5-methylcytosine-specific restriction endonuclease McrA